ncbi:type IV pilin protein [Variovorax sp. WS11]|uniref:type IV pilin protein n=1 Tax=Variovorax sp. WS11 TaxID=1105204 RepID=UPI0026D5FF2C
MTMINQTRRRQRGFTLIEVMIVVAIVAILSAIAYPSYLESVRKSKRAEARAQLMEAAQYMQRFYSQNDSFISSVRSGRPQT